MSSTNGMTFTASEVIDILKACRDTGVAEFEGGGFRVVLDRPVQAGAWDFRTPDPLPPAVSPPADTLAEPDHEKQTQDAVELDELMLKEDQIAELLVVDPLLAEEMISKGDLVENDEPRNEETA